MTPAGVRAAGAPAAAAPAANVQAADVQAVVFGLDDDVFALSVEAVREILDHRPASHLPNAPSWLTGLMDVRGESVPVIDLRGRLGLSPAPVTTMTRILVVDLMLAGRHLLLGLIVDRVLEVATFAGGALEAVPDIGVRWRSDHVAGVVQRDGGFVMLLNLPAIFDGAALPAVPVAAAA